MWCDTDNHSQLPATKADQTQWLLQGASLLPNLTECHGWGSIPIASLMNYLMIAWDRGGKVREYYTQFNISVDLQ